ncbi:uncharacterized protein LOC120342310 [Styela clava]
MLSALKLKQTAAFAFGKNADMASKPSDKCREITPAPTGSKRTDCESKTGINLRKTSGGRLRKIPSTRYNKRSDRNESHSKTSANRHSKKIPDRSFSYPTNLSRSDDHCRVTQLTSQLSLFQSPFETGCEQDNEQYRYDVNISCHKNQQVWVEQFLLPILEEELGLCCYLHDRDSLPGVTTVKNIAASVKESRVTIICFSKDYISSSWQNYEALLAHHMDPGGWKKRILPIVVEDCALPFKYTVYATLKWPACSDTDTVPASVKLRRRFFICGLLNALGTRDKETILRIYQAYCGKTVSVAQTRTSQFTFEGGEFQNNTRRHASSSESLTKEQCNENRNLAPVK